MSHLLKSIFLNPEDLGMQKYSETDMAEKMKPSTVTVDAHLQEFGIFVSAVLDSHETSEEKMSLHKK